MNSHFSANDSKDFDVHFKNNIESITNQSSGFFNKKVLKMNISLSQKQTKSIDTPISTSYTPITTGYSYHDDSREKTGYIGLRNQGATCYMNAMLQALYHLPAFRRLVYSFPTTGTEDPESSIPLNLQRLFCKMQLSNKAVSTKDLTKSFGWGDSEGFVQHDVHEFCRVLLDNIETKLQGTQLHNGISDLFRGKYNQFIRCLKVNYNSSREEAFYDLQLVVKDMQDLIKSFEKYTEKEILDGDNQYTTSKYGKQDAEIGIEFIELPKILTLHLCRFDFDYNLLNQVKINDFFSFTEEINLSKFLAKGKATSAEYSLFLVSLFILVQFMLVIIILISVLLKHLNGLNLMIHLFQKFFLIMRLKKTLVDKKKRCIQEVRILMINRTVLIF